MSIPSALAVLRLMIVSNFVACSIGMSPGLGALENLVHESRGATVHHGKVDAVADVRIDRGNSGADLETHRDRV
jgi:hypothetical protein